MPQINIQAQLVVIQQIFKVYLCVLCNRKTDAVPIELPAQRKCETCDNLVMLASTCPCLITLKAIFKEIDGVTHRLTLRNEAAQSLINVLYPNLNFQNKSEDELVKVLLEAADTKLQISFDTVEKVIHEVNRED